MKTITESQSSGSFRNGTAGSNPFRSAEQAEIAHDAKMRVCTNDDEPPDGVATLDPCCRALQAVHLGLALRHVAERQQPDRGDLVLVGRRSCWPNHVVRGDRQVPAAPPAQA